MKKALFAFAMTARAARLAVCAAILLAAPFCSFAEIVSWKGMEMGLAQNPKWLKAYKAKGDERLLRKKFAAQKSCRVVVAFGQDNSLEAARAASQLDACKKYLDAGQESGQPPASGQAGQKSLSVAAARLQFLGDYWERDDLLGYSVWSVYEY